MDSKYVYIKKRNQFGKQCFFEDIGPTVEEDILPEPRLNKNFIHQEINHSSTQESVQYALHEIQTTSGKIKNSGIRHFEGSWPKEVNPLDEEAVRRFRQRVIKSDNWTASMNPLMDTMEHIVMQNNTINIHNNYFDDMIPTKLTISPEMRIECVYPDQELNVRPVNHFCWSMDPYQFVVAYCFKDRIELPTNLSPNAYIWNVEIPNKPSVILKSASASMAIEFNQRDPSLLISGLMSGQVCSWDTRTGDSPVQISEPLNSHRNPVNQVYWIHSKTNTEFFSSSNSGTIKWWDVRKLRSPTEVLVMDLEYPERQSINASIPISVLQYESTMGSKFFAGLENGTIVSVNKRAISKTEKLNTRFYCHLGSVLTIDRNPSSLKNFLTVGNNHAKVWTEETRDHCLVQTGREKLGYPTGACWSRSRLSLFFTINTEGTLGAYDLFQGINKPCYRIQICEKSLTTIKPHNDGKILAIGSTNGNVYFVLCGGLFTTTFPNDKYFFLSYLDRCSQYEKAVEGRRKETAMLLTHIPPRISVEGRSLKYRSKGKEKTKQKDVKKLTVKKTAHHGVSPFAGDEEIIEAEKQYFLKLEAEKEAYESEDSREMERIYNIYLKAEQTEREAKMIENQEQVKLLEEASKKRTKSKRTGLGLKTPQKSSFKTEIPVSFEKIGAKLDEESAKSEELVKRKGRKRRALSEIPLKICSMDICEPEVCCADIVKAKKESKVLEKEKESSKRELTKKISFEQKMSLTEWQFWQKKISELNKGIPEYTTLQKKRILLGKDAPPSVLTESVKDATKYVEAWRDNLAVRKSIFYRSRSMPPPMRRIKDEIDDGKEKEKEKEDELIKEEMDVYELKSVESLETKSEIGFTLEETISQSITEEIKRNKNEELYPRISAYYIKSRVLHGVFGRERHTKNFVIVRNVNWTIRDSNEIKWRKLRVTRSEFGKQCIFDICGPNLDEEIKPNPQEMRNYIVKSQCHVNTQYTKQIALHEIQTKAEKTKNIGMYHYEGGWPKEIHPRDDETIARYRRRVEKDDEWAPTLRYLLADMEHNILLNNAVNIYDHYFDDMIPTTLTTEREIRLVDVLPDQETPGRPVTDINWSPEETKIVVCYCFDNLRREIDYNMLTYIWDLARPNKPCMALNASYPTMVCQFNPRDPSLLCGGLMNGQVCCWDVRKSTEPVQLSYPRNSHRYPTTFAKWIYTKTNTEFFSSSWDGQALWWDMRNLRQPTERLIFDLEYPNEPSMERSIGVSSANFEPSMSTKFMFGLQNGIVISGSRKVKTNAEKLSLRFNTHNGVVRSVDRNIFSPKIFLTVSKTNTRIWAEDTREGSLITIRSRGSVQACWNKTRHSLFYIIKENGHLEVYDILENLEKPIIELYLSDVSLTTMAAHENGYILAIGDKNGNIFLTRSTESLGKFDRNEKNNLIMGFDRNSRHVKAVDARLREIKILKTLEIKKLPKLQKIQKAKGKGKQKVQPRVDETKKHKDKTKKGKKNIREEFPEVLLAEDMFFETVEKEKEKFELDEDPELKYSTFVRKFDTKQLKLRAKEADKEKDDSKEDKKIIRKKRSVVAKKMPLDKITEEEKITKIEQMISALLTETSVDEIVPTITDLKKRKIKKKMRVKKFNLCLPRPCTIVCQPKVCCWRKTWLSRKYAPHMRKKLSDRTLTADRTKRSLGNMLELPVEFDIELEKAKREIHQAKKPTDWIKKKRLVQLILLAREKVKKEKENIERERMSRENI